MSYLHKIEVKGDPYQNQIQFEKISHPDFLKMKPLRRKDALARPISKWVPGDLKVERKFWRTFESVTYSWRWAYQKTSFNWNYGKFWNNSKLFYKVIFQMGTSLVNQWSNAHLNTAVTHLKLLYWFVRYLPFWLPYGIKVYVI